jgi:N-acetylneuraminate synthase
LNKNFINISGRKVGENYYPLIVPEIGINHNGSLEMAFKIVDAAKRAGAEIIKHQTHIPSDEMSIEAKSIKPGNSNKNIYSIIEKSSLSEEEEYKLFNYVKKKKMIFLSTPFSKLAIDRLVKFGVDTFKIGSGEFTNLPLIEYAASFKKNLILSTGMVDISFVDIVYKFLKKKKINFIFLHTTSLYPTPDNLVRLESINQLRRNYKNLIVGYSDHTTSNTACYGAVALGASIIEKHFVHSRKIKGPDIICSCDEKSLKELINNCKRMYDQKKGEKIFLKQEQVTRDFAHASIITTASIQKNEKFTRKNLWVKRPGTGEIHAHEYFELLGKRSSIFIDKDIQIKKRYVKNFNK